MAKAKYETFAKVKPLAQRSKLAQTRACSRLRFEPHDSGIHVYAPENRDLPVAAITLRSSGKRLVVGAIRVREHFQRCGLGTRLYEAAAKMAQQDGKTLVSDATRSKCSDAFWQKQVTKGRAVCVKKVRVAVHEDDDRSWTNPVGECGRPILGRSGCSHYALLRSSAGKSLAGGRRGKK